MESLKTIIEQLEMNHAKETEDLLEQKESEHADNWVRAYNNIEAEYKRKENENADNWLQAYNNIEAEHKRDMDECKADHKKEIEEWKARYYALQEEKHVGNNGSVSFDVGGGFEEEQDIERLIDDAAEEENEGKTPLGMYIVLICSSTFADQSLSFVLLFGFFVDSKKTLKAYFVSLQPKLLLETLPGIKFVVLLDFVKIEGTRIPSLEMKRMVSSFYAKAITLCIRALAIC